MTLPPVATGGAEGPEELTRRPPHAPALHEELLLLRLRATREPRGRHADVW
jgi:hypothetical protein